MKYLVVQGGAVCSTKSMSRALRNVVRAIGIERDYATCPCGEKIKLERKVLPLKVAKHTYRVTNVVAVICPNCLSGVRVDMIAAMVRRLRLTRI